MGVLDRFEKGIERAVNGAFAKAFRSEVQPVEIASALKRESDDRATAVARDRVMAPNVFVVELGPADHERLGRWEAALGQELEAVVAEHVTAQRYHLAGPVHVSFEQAPDLDTGLFRVRSASERAGTATPPPDDATPPPGVAAAPMFAPPTATPAPGPPPPPPEAPAGIPGPPGPAAPSRPHNLEVGGRHHDLVQPVTVIGRGGDADIVLDDSGASRRHAEVHLIDGLVRIIDLGSTNGTYVDGAKHTVASLVDGSVITIGRTRIVFHSGDARASAPGGHW